MHGKFKKEKLAMKQSMQSRPKKWLGQHFLVDQNIQKKIIKACAIIPQDTVLEIGSGRGELTRLIAEKTERLVALEVDPRMCAILKNKMTDFPRTKILNQNILRFNLAGFFKGINNLKIIGNLPYNITTPIIAHLFKFRDKIANEFITVQKEFAQRMVATPGTAQWGALSCFVQYYTQPRILFLIKRTCFWPQPKVDSALINLRIKDNLPLTARKQSRLFKVIRKSFQQRRKTLRNSLSGVVSPKRLDRYFDRYNVNKNIRGECLSIGDFINLINS
ncbi:MAG: 16S rRNA (adenine(1518)-N(6)/adenine(1519)-N(6))-dimethyltransferase RsmA [Candidatus Omnitrophota bacterium]